MDEGTLGIAYVLENGRVVLEGAANSWKMNRSSRRFWESGTAA